ncbi:hypothetical protein M8818_001848 [Zalaria obscura]|uniref:Uncharacterized protein n=1 Tax=Zalaria obscura TaxID=2024903 RepID=A0ACC3SKI2_9PEZI
MPLVNIGSPVVRVCAPAGLAGVSIGCDRRRHPREAAHSGFDVPDLDQRSFISTVQALPFTPSVSTIIYIIAFLLLKLQSFPETAPISYNLLYILHYNLQSLYTRVSPTNLTSSHQFHELPGTVPNTKTKPDPPWHKADETFCRLRPITTTQWNNHSTWLNSHSSTTAQSPHRTGISSTRCH